MCVSVSVTYNVRVCAFYDSVNFKIRCVSCDFICHLSVFLSDFRVLFGSAPRRLKSTSTGLLYTHVVLRMPS